MVHELEAPAQFLAAEIVRQPLRRIDEWYPVKRGVRQCTSPSS